MRNHNIIIHPETEKDYDTLDTLVRDSFWNVYRPGCMEHYLLRCLRQDPGYMPSLAFVMEQDGRIIGQNIFMNAVIQADDGRAVPIMTMGPICIAQDMKRQGYGKLLLDYTVEKAREAGAGALCFEGNVAFYGKSGFTYASRYGLRYHGLPEGADASFFLCRELIPGYLDGVTGEYAPPPCYMISEADADEFDRQFPPKQRLKLPGQLV